MRRIILCADDYGQSAAISQGIIELARGGRLSATSCLTESAFWLEPANTLSALDGVIDIGLHFNLTQPFPAQMVPAQPLDRVLRAALTGRIDRRAIVRTLHTQLDRFEQVMQRAPDFVDGHQHVHVFPGIRSVVLTELSQRYRQRKPYLRAVTPPLVGSREMIKTAVLKLLGAGFSGDARRHGLPTNEAFDGIYSLQPEADFPTLMQTWLHRVADRTLLMCHPGQSAADPDDPIRATRPLEFAYLQSDAFGELLVREGIELVRFAPH